MTLMLAGSGLLAAIVFGSILAVDTSERIRDGRDPLLPFLGTCACALAGAVLLLLVLHLTGVPHA